MITFYYSMAISSFCGGLLEGSLLFQALQMELHPDLPFTEHSNIFCLSQLYLHLKD